MQKDREKYNDRLDDFSKLLKHNLEDYRIPVDDDCWNVIEQRMKPVKKRHVLRWAVSSAAVAAILLLLLLFPFKGDEPDTTASTRIITDSVPVSSIRQENRTLAKAAEPVEENKKKESKRNQYTTTKKSSGSVQLILNK